MKILALGAILVTNLCLGAVGDGSSGAPIDGDIISITVMNEEQNNVCYQAENESVVCIIVDNI